MKEVMKEVVVEEPHKAEVREVPVPELSGENEVLIQMKSAGVCGSDHHIYHGLNPCSTYPRIPGHENAGVVVKAGSAVTNVKVGDHVIVDLISTCGTCYQCRIGRKMCVNMCGSEVQAQMAAGENILRLPHPKCTKLMIRWIGKMPPLWNRMLSAPIALTAPGLFRRMWYSSLAQAPLVPLFFRPVKRKDAKWSFAAILMMYPCNARRNTAPTM